MNSQKYAETLHVTLRQAGLKSCIIFGKMSHEERDEYVEKFRNQEVKVLITTNLLARGVDVPSI